MDPQVCRRRMQQVGVDSRSLSCRERPCFPNTLRSTGRSANRVIFATVPLTIAMRHWHSQPCVAAEGRPRDPQSVADVVDFQALVGVPFFGQYNRRFFGPDLRSPTVAARCSGGRQGRLGWLLDQASRGLCCRAPGFEPSPQPPAAHRHGISGIPPDGTRKQRPPQVDKFGLGWLVPAPLAVVISGPWGQRSCKEYVVSMERWCTIGGSAGGCGLL